MEIDIRVKEEREVNLIRYADSCYLRACNRGGEGLLVNDSSGYVIYVSPEDIDNLIKALVHAKKIWS